MTASRAIRRATLPDAPDAAPCAERGVYAAPHASNNRPLA